MFLLGVSASGLMFLPGCLCPGEGRGGSLSRGVFVQLDLRPGGPCLWYHVPSRGSLSRGWGGELCPGRSLCPGVSVQWGLCPVGSLSSGVSVQWGLCQGVSVCWVSVQGCLSREVSVQGYLPRGLCKAESQDRDAPYSEQQAVCMLLERILVVTAFETQPRWMKYTLKIL